MNIQSFLAGPPLGGGPSFGLLALRAAAGLGLMIHGIPKIQNPFGWMGPDAATPGLLLALAAVSEFLGGIGIAIGLLTRPAALGILCTMCVATWTHIAKGDPFVGAGSYELPLVYACLGLFLLLNGAGRFSLDSVLFHKG